jgi:hypothetical protein
VKDYYALWAKTDQAQDSGMATMGWWPIYEEETGEVPHGRCLWHRPRSGEPEALGGGGIGYGGRRRVL